MRKNILPNYLSPAKNDSFVAIDKNNKTIGFVFLKISAWSNGAQAVLEEITVEPKFQKLGIGDKLMQHAQKHLDSQKVKSAMLWVKKDESLIKFYQNKGYKIADDFVVMFR